MEKKKILKDSVKNLLKLNISDKEIIENLKSVGISDDEARVILQETKDDISGKSPAEKKSAESEEKTSEETVEEAAEYIGAQLMGEEPVYEPPKKKYSASDNSKISTDIYSRVYDELEKDDMQTPVIEKQINNPIYSTASSNMSDLWEKGILATIDSKLSEMQKIKGDLDNVLDEKINSKVGAESQKIQTILDSQRTLYANKIDAHLEAKADEMVKVIDAKARHMVDIYAKVQDELSKVQAEKRLNQEFLKSINDKLAQIDSIKSQMISDTNTSLINMESKFGEFMDESKTKRKEMEQQINRALQLESKITEGLMNDARNRIDALALDKQNELSKRIQEKIHELDEMTKQVDPQGINQRLVRMKELEKTLVERQKQIDRIIDSKFGEVRKELVDFKKEVSKIEEANLGELRKQYSSDVDELFAKNILVWNKKLVEKQREVDEIKKSMDIEKFNATMESLDLFKDQFVNTIKKSVSDYNKTKTELANRIMARDKAINDYLKEIDAKMNELTKMQKAFADSATKLMAESSTSAKKTKNSKK